MIATSMLTALLLVAFGYHWLIFGAAAVLALRTFKMPLVVTLVAECRGGAQRLRALAANAVWRDIGAGIGPLLRDH